MTAGANRNSSRHSRETDILYVAPYASERLAIDAAKTKEAATEPIALRRILIGTGEPDPLRIAGERMMSESAVTAAGAETRQSMIRVWLAISAVWVAFWLLIAAVIGVAIQQGSPFEADLNIFALIVLTPPITLFALGAGARFLFEFLLRRS